MINRGNARPQNPGLPLAPVRKTSTGGQQMTSLKSRLYSPLLIAAVTVLAATGGAFRIN